MLELLLSQLIVNEVMNNTSDDACAEFVELYNASNDTIYLNGYSITDGEDMDLLTTFVSAPAYVSSNLHVPPGGFTLILDRDYFANCTVNYNLFGNVITVDDASIGNGISKTDSLFIMDPLGDTVASFTSPIPDIPQNYSIERLNYSTDAFGVSKVIHGTPNRRNSIFTNTFIILDSIYMYEGNFYAILENLSSQLQSDTLYVLSAKDTFVYFLQVDPNDTSVIGIPFTSLRNILILGENIYEVYAPITYPTIVINEVEYDTHEWIELYNSTGDSVDLSNFFLKDASGNSVKLKGKIPPYGYLVLHSDSFPDFPSLNNNYESLILLSNYSLIHDSIYYSYSYGGEGEYTLEKINPSLDPTLSSSWMSSRYPYGTPGKPNSVYMDESKLERRFFIESKHLRLGEELILSFNLEFPSEVEILLYDDVGRFVDRIYRASNVSRDVVRYGTSSLRKGMYIIVFKVESRVFKDWFRIR